MPESAGGQGKAYDASVQTGPPTTPEQFQRQRELLADEAEEQVKVIEEKLAGVKEALAAKKAEAKALRREANEGVE